MFDHNALNVIYLVYGLSFFMMGTVIWVKIRPIMDNKIARSFAWLAVFGIIHGIHEWVEMFYVMGHVGRVFLKSRAVFVAFSYAALMMFGLKLQRINKEKNILMSALPTVLFTLWLLAFGMLQFRSGSGQMSEILARYFLGILGALIAGLSLIRKSHDITDDSKTQRSLYSAGIFMFYYALLTFVGPKADFFPASLINYESFVEIFKLPAQLFRAVAAVGTAVFTIFSLEVFDVVEKRRLVTEIESAEEELKRRFDVQKVINSVLSFSLREESLEKILDHALELILSVPWITLQKKAGIFLTQERKPDSLVLIAKKNLPEAVLRSCKRVSFGKCLCGRAAVEKKILYSFSLDERHEIRYAGIASHGHYNIPIVSEGKALGVIVLYLEAGHSRRKAEENFLKAFSDALATVIVRKKAEKDKETLQAQLLQAQKIEALGRLAGNIAHDFNNILNAVTGYSELLLQDMKEDNPARKDMEEIKKAGERGAHMTKQLLSFSRKREVRRRAFSLNDTVKDLSKMLGRLVGERVDIKTELDPGLKLIKMDIGQMEQVLMNLAINARDAMPEGGTLTIKTKNMDIDKDEAQNVSGSRPGKFVCMIVSDTGVGIEKDDMDKIFEPFFSTKGIGHGTGLGLSVVFGIIKQHDGWVKVQSEKDVGTTFQVYLPITAENPQEEGGKPEFSFKDMRGNGEKILIVEDNEGVLNFASNALSKFGYSVLRAMGIEEAMEILKRNDVDLVFCDVILKQGSGVDLMNQAGSLKLSKNYISD